MGDPKLADEALIPPVVGLDDPRYLLHHGNLDYEAEARLVNDNLLDLTHLHYLHESTLGPPPKFETREKMTMLERGVRFETWFIATPPPFGPPGRLMDNYVTYDFLVPGVYFASGTAAAANFGKPDYANAAAGVVFVNQVATPLARRRSRYFFSSGPHRQHGNEAVRDMLGEMARMAFAEDDARFLVIANDKGVVLYNRLVKKLVAAEAGLPTGENRVLAPQAA
jgi:vanillate O-demethylase monooxygenase subunit